MCTLVKNMFFIGVHHSFFFGVIPFHQRSVNYTQSSTSHPPPWIPQGLETWWRRTSQPPATWTSWCCAGGVHAEKGLEIPNVGWQKHWVFGTNWKKYPSKLTLKFWDGMQSFLRVCAAEEMKRLPTLTDMVPLEGIHQPFCVTPLLSKS